MLITELFNSHKKLLLGGSNAGRGTTPNPFTSKGVGATGIGQNSATSSANSLTKGMDGAKSLTRGLDGVQSLVRTEVAAGRGTKRIDNQSASGDNSIQKTPQQRVAEYEQNQRNSNTNNANNTNKIKQDKFEGQSGNYDFNTHVAEQKSAKISYGGASSVVAKPDIKPLTQQTIAVAVGAGNNSSAAYQVGSGNYNNDSSVNANIKGLVSDQVQTQFSNQFGRQAQQAQYGPQTIGIGQGAYSNVNPLVNGATQTQFIPGQAIQMTNGQAPIPVGQSSPNNPNYNPNDPLNKGFLAQTVVGPTTQSAQQVIGVGQSAQTVIGVGQREAKTFVQNSSKDILDFDFYERVLRETIVTVDSKCKSVYEFYLVDLSFAFPADLITLIEDKRLRVRIGTSQSVAIKKDPTGQFYALVDVGSYNPKAGENEKSGYRRVQLDLNQPENKQEFSQASSIQISKTNSDIVNKDQIIHNKNLKERRKETKGNSEVSASYDLYRKLARETKLRYDSKSKFAEGEDVELIFLFPDIDENQRIPETLFVKVNGLPFKTLIQLDKENKKEVGYKYHINLGKYRIIDDNDKLEISLEIPSTLTDSGSVELEVFQKISVQLIKAHDTESDKDLGALVSSIGTVALGKGKQEVIELGQSGNKAKGIGNSDTKYDWAANPGAAAAAVASAAGSRPNSGYGGNGNNSGGSTGGRSFDSNSGGSRGGRGGSGSGGYSGGSSNPTPSGAQSLDALRQSNRTGSGNNSGSGSSFGAPTGGTQRINIANVGKTGDSTRPNVLMGGPNGDIPLVDAQGRPLIAGDNKFNSRTNVVGSAISSVFNSKSNTIAAVVQGGNLISNSTGRADVNQTPPTDNQGGGAGQPPNPPKPPTGGNTPPLEPEDENPQDLNPKSDFEGIPDPWDDVTAKVEEPGYTSKPQQKLLSGTELSRLALPAGVTQEELDAIDEEGELDGEKLKQDLIAAAGVLAAAKVVDPVKANQELISKINTRTTLPQSVEARTNARDEDKALPADTEPLGPSVIDKFSSAVKDAASAAAKNAIRGFLAANAPIIAGIIAVCLLFLMILAAVIAIECDGGKSDKVTFDTFEENIKKIELGLNVVSGNYKEAGTDAASDQFKKFTGQNSNRSKLNQWIVKNIPGCESNPCATSGAGVGKVNGINGEYGTAKGIVTSAECAKLKEYKGFIEEAASTYGIPAPIIAGMMSRETQVGLGAVKPKGCAGMGDANNGHGLVQIDGASGAWGNSTRGPRAPGTPTIQKGKDGKPFIWDDCRSNILYGAYHIDEIAKLYKKTADSKGAKGSYNWWKSVLGGYNGGGKGAQDEKNTALGNYGTDTLNRAADAANCLGISLTPGLKEGAIKPAQVDKFAEPIRLAQIEEARTIVNKKLSKIIGVPVNYKTTAENNANPEMKSYSIPDFDRRINQFNEFMKGEVIVEAADASVIPTPTDGLEERKELKARIQSGKITSGNIQPTSSIITDVDKLYLNLVKLILALDDKFPGMAINVLITGHTSNAKKSAHVYGAAVDIGGIEKGKGGPQDSNVDKVVEFINFALSTGVIQQIGLPDGSEMYKKASAANPTVSFYADGLGHIHLHVKGSSADFKGGTSTTSTSGAAGSDPCCPDGGSSSTPAATESTTSTSSTATSSAKKVELEDIFESIEANAAETTQTSAVDVATARKKLVELFDQGFIGQTKNPQVSDRAGYEKEFDDNVILFQYDLYFKAGITWISGFNNHGRGRDHAPASGSGTGSAVDYWAFARVADFGGQGKKLTEIDGRPQDFGSFVSGMGPIPSDEGNKSNPKIIRHIDIFSKNNQISKLAIDITIEVASLAYSSGVLKGNGAQVFTADIVANTLRTKFPGSAFTGHTASIGYANQQTPIGISNGHHNHIHISLLKAKDKKYGGISGEYSASASSCCPSASSTPTVPPATVASSSSSSDKKAQLLEKLFDNIEVQAAGSPPSSYSAINAEHKKLLAEAAAKIKAPTYEDGGSLKPETKAAFAKLKADAKGKGFNLSLKSDYRSYDTQVITYFTNGESDKITDFYRDGMTAIERNKVLAAYVKRGESSFPPGFSEHSTGLAIDIIGSDGVSASLNRDTYPKPLAEYLAINGPKFGFSLSFDKNSGGANGGAKYEPWHWYFGVSKSKSGSTSTATGSGSGSAGCCPTTPESPTTPTASSSSSSAKKASLELEELFESIVANAESQAQILATKVDTVANQGLSGEEKAFLDMISVKENGKYGERKAVGSAANVGKYQIGNSDVKDAINALNLAGYNVGNLSVSNWLEPANQDLVAIGRVLRRIKNNKQKLSQILVGNNGFLNALGYASEEFQALPAVPGHNHSGGKEVGNGYTIAVATAYYKQQLAKYGAGGGNGLTGSNSTGAGNCEPATSLANTESTSSSKSASSKKAELLYFEKQKVIL